MGTVTHFPERAMNPPFSSLLVIVLFTSSVLPSAHADGKFFRRAEVADEPGIAAQRAVLAFRDGVETLIVASEVESTDTSFGWILPLPAEPVSIEPCPANTLDALASLLPPRIVEVPRPVPLVAGLLALAALIAGVEHVRARRANRRSGWAPLALAGGLLVGAVLLCMPTLSRARGVGAGGVQVLRSEKAGVYDVTVIQGDSAESVEAWLTSNGFAAPPTATAVLREYVAEGWCFLAARISRDAGTDATHHPLKITFPAEKPVYPMRLTGSDGQPLRLDLFVIGDRAADAPGMTPWFRGAVESDAGYASGGEIGGEYPPVFRATAGEFVAAVGLPAVADLLWDGCTLTRLHGRLGPGEMKADIAPRWETKPPQRHPVYARSSALTYAGGVAALAFVVLFLAAASAAGAKRAPVGAFLRRRGVPALLLAVAIGAGRYFTLDVERIRVEERGRLATIIAVGAHREALAELTREPPAGPFPDAYRKRVRSLYAQASDAREPSAPGDYRIEALDEGWRLTILDRNYIPVTVHIGADGVPR